MTQPWRRGSAVPQTSTGKRTQSIRANPPSTHTPSIKAGQGIGKDGLRMARKDLGGKREQDEFSLLLSPSRGIADDDPTSLKNPEIQERFRDHIAGKLKKWSIAHPFGTYSSDPKRKNEELGIILLDLRKLREGIHSIRRIDTFACEVYEASVLLSLLASNQAQLLSSLPHLVTVIHPTLAQDDLSTSLSTLSVAQTTPPSRPPPSQATRSFYLTLHLLHSHLLPAFTNPTSSPSSTSSSSSPPLTNFLHTLLSLLTLSSLPHPPLLRPGLFPFSTQPSPPTDPSITFLLSLHIALIRTSLPKISSLLDSRNLPVPPSELTSHFKSLLSLSNRSAPNPLAILLRGSVPSLREEWFKSVVGKAFRFPPDQKEWLSKWFLFEFEVKVERELGLVETGKGSGEGKRKDSSDSWDEKEDEDEEEEEGEKWVREEAERRVVDFIERKRGQR